MLQDGSQFGECFSSEPQMVSKLLRTPLVWCQMFLGPSIAGGRSSTLGLRRRGGGFGGGQGPAAGFQLRAGEPAPRGALDFGRGVGGWWGGWGWRGMSLAGGVELLGGGRLFSGLGLGRARGKESRVDVAFMVKEGSVARSELTFGSFSTLASFVGPLLFPDPLGNPIAQSGQVPPIGGPRYVLAMWFGL